MAPDKWWLIERLISLFSITICCVLPAKTMLITSSAPKTWHIN